MENLKQLLTKVNKDNPSEFDVRLVSLKKFYNDLKKSGNIDEWKRFKLIVHLYPNVLYRNSFRSIESMVHSPNGKRMAIRDRKTFTKYEEYALKRYYGSEIPNSSYLMFYISDLYDYFGLKH